MHCTWFNENKTKKKVNFPYIFFCGLFPLLNTSPHLSPSSSLPAPHTTTWERSATPTSVLPRVPRRAPWAPAQLACSF